MRFPKLPSKRTKVFWCIVGFALILLLGVIDYKVGVEFRFAFFYLVPITLVSWLSGMKPGIGVAVLSVFAWITANLLLGHGFSNAKVGLGNAATVFGFFVVISLLTSKLTSVVQREREIARTDHLTGAPNARAFHEIAQREIDRARRYKRPFTIAYFDVDNFKAVNDEAGHQAGDDLLRVIVKTIKDSIRETDTVARLGGDEFAVLFPESPYESIGEAIRRIQEELFAAHPGGFGPITFSIGALTCGTPPPTLDEMMRKVDQLMYAVKSEGKNRLKHETLTSVHVRDDCQPLAPH